nr:MAG TPA: hypothetical protein [Caudoviricetes sp.]
MVHTGMLFHNQQLFQILVVTLLNHMYHRRLMT